MPITKNIRSTQINLIILDGWGKEFRYHGNAIKQAKTPIFDFLWHNYPHTLLHASENHVGLPSNQVGNSEVGHTTIGAGRTIDQALVRISKSIKDNSFFKNETLNSIYNLSQKKHGKIHLIGLCSDGGVHSHIDHLIELLKVSKKYNKINTCIHIITDGRDTKPQNAKKFAYLLLECIKSYPNITISTISGRYYSMDRDCRWERTQQTYKCLVNNEINETYKNDILSFINDSYNKKIYDEFMIPTRINQGKIENNDGIIFFNFRPDRMRQLVQAFCVNNFEGFKTEKIQDLNVATFTMYDSQLNLPVVFNKIVMNNFLGQVISENEMKQFRLAETEKYAHVTYFFNGGREEPFPGEDRALIPSPQVETYDLTPQMSALDITSKLIELNKSKKYKLIITNYANPDMIGHTGNFSCTKLAVEIIDRCLNSIIKTVDLHQTILIITADHGNADIMFDRNNEPCKSHSKNRVPFIIVNENNDIKKMKLQESGSLTDIASTILHLLSIKKPSEMNGKSLIKTESNKINDMNTRSKHSIY